MVVSHIREWFHNFWGMGASLPTQGARRGPLDPPGVTNLQVRGRFGGRTGYVTTW